MPRRSPKSTPDVLTWRRGCNTPQSTRRSKRTISRQEQSQTRTPECIEEEWPTHRPLLFDVNEIRRKYNPKNYLYMPDRKTQAYRERRWGPATLLEVVTVYEHVPRQHREGVLPNAFDTKARPYADISRKMEQAWLRSIPRREKKAAAPSVERIPHHHHLSSRRQAHWTWDGPSQGTPEPKEWRRHANSSRYNGSRDAAASRPSSSPSTPEGSVFSNESYRPRSVSTTASSVPEQGPVENNLSSSRSSEGSEMFNHEWSPAELSSPVTSVQDEEDCEMSYDPADDNHVSRQSAVERESTPWAELNNRAKQSGCRYVPPTFPQVVIYARTKPADRPTNTSAAGQSESVIVRKPEKRGAAQVCTVNINTATKGCTRTASNPKHAMNNTPDSSYRASSTSESDASSRSTSTSRTSRRSPVYSLSYESHGASNPDSFNHVMNLFDQQKTTGPVLPARNSSESPGSQIDETYCAALADARSGKKPVFRLSDEMESEDYSCTRSSASRRCRSQTEETDEMYRVTPGLKRAKTATDSEKSRQTTGHSMSQRIKSHAERGPVVIDLTEPPEVEFKKKIQSLQLQAHRNNFRRAGTVDNYLTKALLAAQDGVREDD